MASSESLLWWSQRTLLKCESIQTQRHLITGGWACRNRLLCILSPGLLFNRNKYTVAPQSYSLPQSASEFLIGFQADCPFKLRTPQAAFKASSTLSCDSELLQCKERKRPSHSSCHTEVQGPKYDCSIYVPWMTGKDDPYLHSTR